MTSLEQAEQFLKETYEKSEYLTAHPADKMYRLEHSYRVANIAREIARKEGLPQEELTIAGLLHDISYCDAFRSEEDWMDHGRKSARMVRDFLEKAGFSREMTEEICYGIAIHVDGEADFAGERTAFAQTVGDADNIDRFDAYRIYEKLQYRGCYGIAIHVDGEADFAGERTAFAQTVGDADNIDRFDAYRIYEKLQYRGFSERSLEEKKKLVSETLERLKKYQQEEFGTRTATEMWRGRIAFWAEFYRKLWDQLANSEQIR